MTFQEAQQYWFPARGPIHRPDSFERAVHASQQLAGLLGLQYPVAQHWKHIQLTPELKSQLLALSGPHRNSIAKVMRIRREQDEAGKV